MVEPGPPRGGFDADCYEHVGRTDGLFVPHIRDAAHAEVSLFATSVGWIDRGSGVGGLGLPASAGARTARDFRCRRRVLLLDSLLPRGSRSALGYLPHGGSHRARPRNGSSPLITLDCLLARAPGSPSCVLPHILSGLEQIARPA